MNTKPLALITLSVGTILATACGIEGEIQGGPSLATSMPGPLQNAEPLEALESSEQGLTSSCDSSSGCGTYDFSNRIVCYCFHGNASNPANRRKYEAAFYTFKDLMHWAGTYGGSAEGCSSYRLLSSGKARHTLYCAY